MGARGRAGSAGGGLGLRSGSGFGYPTARFAESPPFLPGRRRTVVRELDSAWILWITWISSACRPQASGSGMRWSLVPGHASTMIYVTVLLVRDCDLVWALWDAL